MSKVDWSLAPKGATHWVGGMHPWHQNIGTTVFYWSTCGGCWKKLTGFDVDQVNSQYLGVIQERPKQPQAWSGPEDGLPPVGETCERRFDDLEDSSWQQITVIAYGKRKVFYSDKNGDEWAHYTSELEFRAIKTQEHVARDQRESAIREFMDVVGIDCRVTASKAVDAGFKREVV